MPFPSSVIWVMTQRPGEMDLDYWKRDGFRSVRVGMGFRPLEYPINDITVNAISIIGHMGYDTTSWRNGLRLLEKGWIQIGKSRHGLQTFGVSDKRHYS